MHPGTAARRAFHREGELGRDEGWKRGAPRSRRRNGPGPPICRPRHGSNNDTLTPATRIRSPPGAPPARFIDRDQRPKAAQRHHKDKGGARGAPQGRNGDSSRPSHVVIPKGHGGRTADRSGWGHRRRWMDHGSLPRPAPLIAPCHSPRPKLSPGSHHRHPELAGSASSRRLSSNSIRPREARARWDRSAKDPDDDPANRFHAPGSIARRVYPARSLEPLSDGRCPARRPPARASPALHPGQPKCRWRTRPRTRSRRREESGTLGLACAGFSRMIDV
jgi:hypothetical protein